MIGKSDGKQEFFSSNYTFCHDFTEEYKDVISNWTIYDKYILRSFAEKEDKQTFFDDKSILEPSDDAATIKCGPSWRTPTDEEWSELWTLCDWQWTSINGKPGYLVTGTNGNSIFLPVTGYCSGKSFSNKNYNGLVGGYYWSSTLRTNNNMLANTCYFNKSEYGRYYQSRWYGISIRPVFAESETAHHYRVNLGLGQELTMGTSTNENVQWRSSNPDVVVVSDLGEISAVGYGLATIFTSSTQDSSRHTALEVHVVEPEHDPYNGHEYIDMGLSVKWAASNVGTELSWASGTYYMWGATEWKSSYDGWTNYPLCNGTETNFTKYCSNAKCGKVDCKVVLDAEDDVAHQEWGGDWYIPTEEEWKELKDNCTWSYVSRYENGSTRKGYEVKSKINGNTLFIRCGGCRNPGKNGTSDVDSIGYYWSATRQGNDFLSSDTPTNALFMQLTGNSYYISNARRCCEFSIRPVCRVK